MKLLNFDRLSENIDSIAEYDFSNNKVFGSAYMVYQDGTVFEKYCGTERLNSDRNIDSSSIFRMASMSKPVTAFAALILVDRGLLSLDDTIDRYIPEFANIKIIDEDGSSVAPKKIPTIRNLLTHTSGIGSNVSKCAAMTADDNKDLDSTIKYFLKAGMDFEPDSMQYYSATAAFDVMVKIIEIITGTDYLEFLKKEVFMPCQMYNTTFIPTPEQQDRMVEMHYKADGKNAVFKMPEGCTFENIPWTHYLGGAGLISTLQDYANFAKMLLNKGQTENGRIVSEETFNQLCSPQVAKEIMDYDERWGLGVRVITEDSHPNLPKYSFGWSGAYGTHFWVDLQNKIFAVYMKNSVFDGGAGNESATKFENAVYASF